MDLASAWILLDSGFQNLRGPPREISAGGQGLWDFLHVFQINEELRKLRSVLPKQTAQVEDGCMVLAAIPHWHEPPASRPPGLIEVRLEPSQQCERHNLDLKGAQDRLLRPGPAFLHAQTLLVVMQPVFLPEACSPGFHHLRGRQVQNRGDHEPGLLGPCHLDHQDVHGDLRPADRLAAPKLCVLETARPAIAPGMTGLPANRPVQYR
jgi:hypothetical protein